jgi:hypothetical protein
MREREREREEEEEMHLIFSDLIIIVDGRRPI